MVSVPTLFLTAQKCSYSETLSHEANGWVPESWCQGQPQRADTQLNTSQYLCHRCPCPHSEPQQPSAYLSRRSSRSLNIGLGPGSYEMTAFAFIPIRMFCLALSRVSLFVPSCGSPAQALLTFKAEMLWGLFLLMPGLRLGILTWSSELSLLWENFFITVLQFADHLCGVMGFDYIVVHVSYRLGAFLLYVFGCRISSFSSFSFLFFVCFCLFKINICSAAVSSEFGVTAAKEGKS